MNVRDASYREILAELVKRDISFADIARSLETSRQHVRWILRTFSASDRLPCRPLGRAIIQAVDAAMAIPYSNGHTKASISCEAPPAHDHGQHYASDCANGEKPTHG